MLRRFGLLLAATFSASAFATHAIQLKSEDGTRVEIQYDFEASVPDNCYKCPVTTYARPLAIYLTSDAFVHDDRARVVLLNFRRYQHTPRTETLQVKEVDFEPAGDGRLVAHVPEGLAAYESGYPGQAFFRQELAVVVNGEWLQDPVSRTNNFGFRLLTK